MDLVSQLNRIYWDEEKWVCGDSLNEQEATKYHDYILRNGLCITVEDRDVLVGYCEFWRLTHEHFSRIICGERLSPLLNDFKTGYIAYVANTYIKLEYRKGKVARLLRDRFFEANKDCVYFVGIALRKKHQPVKVFKREDIFLEKNKSETESLQLQFV